MEEIRAVVASFKEAWEEIASIPGEVKGRFENGLDRLVQWDF